MVDIGDTVQAKSDQLNADDLLDGRSMVIKITRVIVKKGDQPVTIHYENDNGKPYKPSLGMRRVLIAMWGETSADYVGRHLELYRDPEVQFGSLTVGGLRIGAASHIDRDRTIAIQVKKGKKAGHLVKLLRVPAGGGQQQRQQQDPPTIEGATSAIAGAKTVEALEKLWGNPRMAGFQEQLQDAYDARRDALLAAALPKDDNPPAQDGAGKQEDWNV